MPSSSMRLTSAASEKRGGGSVKCCEALIACFSSNSPSLIAGRRRRLLVVAGLVLAFLIEREEAVELHHLAGGAQVDVARAGLAPRYRRWCARVRRIASGSPRRGSRSARRGGPGRGRRIWRPRSACGWDRSGGPLRALPARSSICSGRCAALPARIPCRNSCRSSARMSVIASGAMSMPSVRI